MRFQLDDRRRWSLWYHGDGQPVPLLRDAVVGAWIGDRLVTLGDLEDTASGTRRPPGGDAIVVRGRAAAVYLEAAFFSGDASPAPQAAVTLSVYPDRALPTVKGVRFFHAGEAEILPGEGPLLAHVNGYHSRSVDRVEGISADMGETASHGALGLTRGGRGLALSFDPGEPGEARVRISPAGLDAVSDWLPTRALRAEGDAATMRLSYVPAGDGLDALRALFQPASPVDRERFAAMVVPAGWCSWYELFGNVTEADMIANLEFCAAHFDRRHFRLIQLDDGYQKATGAWDTNTKFPHGHRWLTDQIHAKGFQAGLWVAPFAVTDRSGIPDAHPDWLLRDESGPILWDTREDWGGGVYSIDGAHPAVQEWLYQLARRVVREWGYDYLKIDFLLWATKGVAHYGGRTHAEAYRLGLAAIREGLGGSAFLLGCGAPLQHAVGYMDGMRIGSDVDATWGGIQAPARAAALRSFYHRAVWINDPDCLLVRPPLTEAEAQTWAAIVSVSGGMTLFSDDLPKLPLERVPVLQRTIPVAPVTGRPVGTATGERAIAPAMWVAEGASRWWTVVLVNWEGDPRDVSVPLASLGLTGRRFTAYDVWRDAPLPDVTDRIAATILPHSSLTLGLRAAVARPRVIGTTRHVVQGAVDVVDETWDRATRTLRAGAVSLDDRPYKVTIAVPRGMRPGECKAERPCTITRLKSGHAVLEWQPDPEGRDIAWELSFRPLRRE
ncbi:MAG: alpha-galactosidase [Gemmatimonadetes bacterium]|nr:alpha-galactosidase [Gemmatimonadota bacterium]